MASRKHKDLFENVLKHRWPLPANPRPPQIGYHLRMAQPIKWTQARELQNAIIRAYQQYHRRPIQGKILPPTFITFRFTPVFTYGRRDPRPEVLDKRMLEGLMEIEGYRPETRMAWARDHGWFFFGPGQIQCWMVADLTHWHWDVNDVELLMNASLASVMSHYLPAKPSEVKDYNPQTEYRSITQGPPKPDTRFFKELSHVELWQNNHGVISYGCSLNVRKDQILWTNRISRYGFEAPPTSSLDVEGWTINENTKVIEMRLVAELCARIGVTPEIVDSNSLGRILSTKIQSPGPWVYIPKPVPLRKGDPGRLLNRLRLAKEGSSWARREVYIKWFPWEIKNRLTHPVFVKGWGQYIRKGMLETQEVEVIPAGERGANVKLKQRSDKGWQIFEQEEEEKPTYSTSVRDRDTVRELQSLVEEAVEEADLERPQRTESEGAEEFAERRQEAVEEFTPPPDIIYATIAWSSADFVFHPRVDQDVLRRATFSPSSVSDVDFLDPPAISPEKQKLLALLESQKRVITEMRIKDRSIKSESALS